MPSQQFWIALGLSTIAHLLVLQVPAHIGDGGGPMRKAEVLEARLAPQKLVAAAPAASEQDTAPPPAPPPAPREQFVPQAGIPAPTHYFKSAEVDKRAEPLELAPLVYPEGAFLRRIEGRVLLRVYVNELGGIDAIDVVEAEPAGLFEQAAIDAVLNTRFLPAELFGRPVKNVKTLEVRFDPRSEQPR